MVDMLTSICYAVFIITIIDNNTVTVSSIISYCKKNRKMPHHSRI